MVEKLFGTDGIRGTANVEPMTAETALKVGMAAAMQLMRGAEHHRRAVIGKDTRLSGYMLEPALTAGFISMGMNVTLVGPLPTPAIAMLTRSLRADLGVMITASHNPYQDNGIKLFGPDGYKLSDAVEEAIAAGVRNGLASHLAPADKLGKAVRLDDALGRYNEFVKQSFPKGLRLDGVKIVIDCANGAAYKIAPEVLWELGAEVIPLGVTPDGFNINRDCGSTATDAMCNRVVTSGADIGIALDGDADRVLIADETGRLIDGDQMMAMIAEGALNNGSLRGGGVVATVMSNIGLERYLDGLNLKLVRTKVGDRYVLEHMRAHGFNVGGEQSGHIILTDFGTTGDGLIATLQVLASLVLSGKSASVACRKFTPFPQVLKNVRYQHGKPLENEGVKASIAAGEQRLDGHGRLLIRKSGTEPLIRVMGEGDDEAVVTAVVDDIVGAITRAAR